jgi:hypothetical protein
MSRPRHERRRPRAQAETPAPRAHKRRIGGASIMKRARSKWAKSERNKLESPFAPFPAQMIDSPAFHMLPASGSAFKLLLMLGAVWARNGGLKHNTNGQLIVTYEQFCKYWGMDSHSVARAIRVLVALGFLERAKGCGGNADQHEPNTYRLTFLPAEGFPGTGTHDYRRIKTKEEAEAIVRAARRARDDAPKRVPVPFKAESQGALRPLSRGAPSTVEAGTASPLRPLSPPCAAHLPSYISPHRHTAVPAKGDGGRVLPTKQAKSAWPRCEVCGVDLQSRRSDARFCAEACKKRSRRRRDIREEGR